MLISDWSSDVCSSDLVEVQGSIAMIVLLPFAAYLSAEELGVSGILAAVAAGMALNLKGASTDPGAQTRIASAHICSMSASVITGVRIVQWGDQWPETRQSVGVGKSMSVRKKQ